MSQLPIPPRGVDLSHFWQTGAVLQILTSVDSDAPSVVCLFHVINRMVIESWGRVTLLPFWIRAKVLEVGSTAYSGCFLPYSHTFAGWFCMWLTISHTTPNLLKRCRMFKACWEVYCISSFLIFQTSHSHYSTIIYKKTLDHGGRLPPGFVLRRCHASNPVREFNALTSPFNFDWITLHWWPYKFRL